MGTTGAVGAGYLAVGGAAVLWAVGGSVASRLIDRGASFVELTEARAWITALSLACAMRLRHPPAPAGRAPWWLVLAFGGSLSAANLTYYASLSLLPVAVAITVQYTAPVLVVLWAAFAEAKPPSFRIVLALAASVAGVALLAELPVVVAEGRSPLPVAGFAVAGASALAFAVYMVTGERLSRLVGTRHAVFRGFLVASVLWAVVQGARGRPDTLLDARFVPWVVFLAFVTTIAPFSLFAWGLTRVSASSAGIVSTLEPLTAAAIAFVWLGQSLGTWQLAGGALVLIGVGVVQADRPSSPEVLAERAAIE